MAWSIETQRYKVGTILRKHGIKCFVSKPDAAESTVKVETDKKPRIDVMRSVEELFPNHVFLLWVFDVVITPEHQPTVFPELTPEAGDE